MPPDQCPGLFPRGMIVEEKCWTKRSVGKKKEDVLLLMSQPAALQQDAGKRGILRILNLEDTSPEHLAPSTIERSAERRVLRTTNVPGQFTLFPGRTRLLNRKNIGDVDNTRLGNFGAARELASLVSENPELRQSQLAQNGMFVLEPDRSLTRSNDRSA